MTKEVLVGPFLDFGNSYWGSTKMVQEHPGLMQKGFESTGQYGIGFYSVFMWGDKVEIITRSRHAAPSDTLVLEFQNGLTDRPVLRNAELGEELTDSGTIIRVRLNNKVKNTNGLLSKLTILGRFQQKIEVPDDLRQLCAWICPASDVNICVKTCEHPIAKVVEANDWISMPGGLLLARLYGIKKSSNHLKLFKELGKNLRTIVNADNKVVARLAIKIAYEGKPFSRFKAL